MKAPQKGFSLIELLVVVAIILILIAMLVPTIKSVMYKGHVLTCKSNLRQLHVAGVQFGSDYKLQPRRFPFNHHQPELFWRFSNGSGDHPHESGGGGGVRLPRACANALFNHGYVVDPNLFFCPLAPVDALLFNPTPPHDYRTFSGSYSYGWKSVKASIDRYQRLNSNGIRYSQDPPREVVLYDCVNSLWSQFRQPDGYKYEHYNAVFSDGHAELVAYDDRDFLTWLWGPEARPY